MNRGRAVLHPALGLALGLLLVHVGPALAASPLRLAPASRSLGVRTALEAPAQQGRPFPHVLTAPGQRLRTALQTCDAQLPCPDTIRVAFIRIDFRDDRGGSASTGNGRFDWSGPDPNGSPIDPPPHNRAFFESHAEALRLYYDAQSYGDVAVVADVWPRDGNDAYSLRDMADYGPWTFGADLYPEAVRLFRDMAFEADSQSVLRSDRIPWDAYDRIAFIHAGSDHQSDVAGDSPEDIPTFTIGVFGDDAVIFADSANRPITQASILPETISQDGLYGAINGIVAHESGHNCFGLYDALDVRADSTVVGFWSLMDAGPRVGAIVMLPDMSLVFATGLLPPSIDPWNRQFLSSSIVATEIAVGDTVQLMEVAGGTNRIRRVTLNADEYLLIEWRFVDGTATIALLRDPVTGVVLGPELPNPLAYDALLPGGGVLIWHVDDFVIRRDFALNMDPTRRGLELIEADGLDDLGNPASPYMLGAATDPWYGGNNSELGSTTTPALTTHAGDDPHLRISVIDQYFMRVGVAPEPPTATLLTRFQAEAGAEGVAVRWQFAAYDPEATASLERGDAPIGPWRTIATAPLDRDDRVFVDRDVQTGQEYFYRLRSTSPTAGEALYGPVRVGSGAPAAELSLAVTGAHPAGRAPVGITYSIASESRVRIAVVDVQGRQVHLLADEVTTPGPHTIAWDHAGTAAGLYFIVAQSGSRRASRRLVIAP